MDDDSINKRFLLKTTLSMARTACKLYNLSNDKTESMRKKIFLPFESAEEFLESTTNRKNNALEYNKAQAENVFLRDTVIVYMARLGRVLKELSHPSYKENLDFFKDIIFLRNIYEHIEEYALGNGDHQNTYTHKTPNISCDAMGIIEDENGINFGNRVSYNKILSFLENLKIEEDFVEPDVI